jgi:hypothetical protein
MKTIIILISLIFLVSCVPLQDKSFTTERPDLIKIEMPKTTTDPFKLGKEVKTPSGCVDGVDC